MDNRELSPLTPRQERMYFMQLANPESRAFNLSFVINLKAMPDSSLPSTILDKIRSAMNIIVSRHDALRVTFVCSRPADDKMVSPSLSQASSCSCVNSGNIHVTQKLNDPSELDICTFSTLIHCSCHKHEMFSQIGCGSCTIRQEIFKPFDMTKQLFRCAVFTPSDQEIILCLVFHHMITDGMSLFVLSNELLALLREDSSPDLQRAITNSESNPGPSALQIVQARMVDPTAKKRSLEKWVTLLSDTESCTDLSSDQYGQQMPNSVHPHMADDVFLELSGKSSRSISHLSQTYHVSQAVVIATMYSLALHHFTGERDIIIGMVSANRSRATENTVGYFANTLTLRVNLNSLHASNLQSLMKDVRKNWSMILMGGIDLVDLVPCVPCLRHKSSGRESSVHSSPLQVLFSFYDVGEGKSLPNKFTISGIEIECEVTVPKPGHTHADLWMEANPNYWNGNGKQVFHWEYRQSILTRSMVEFLHMILCRYLKAASDAVTVGKAATINPLELRIQTLDLSLSQVDGSRLFKNNEIQDTSHLCYIQRFEQKCQECPHSPAFRIDNDSVYTYKDVQSMMSAIALFLIKTHAVKPGDRVALLLPRDPNLYLVVLAILKCGAAYVPITADTTLPGSEDRLVKILKVANAKLLLTVKSLWNSLPSRIGSVVYLDELLANLQYHKSSSLPGTDLAILADLEVKYSPDLLFYILFTSGTTGEPKAVGITNANLNTTFNNFLHLLTPEETKLTLAATSINFDSHVLDSLAPLLNGACLVVAKNALDLADVHQESFDFNDSGVSLNASGSSSSSSSYFDGITFTFATPSTASVVDFPSSMQAIMIGGEVFTKVCYQKTKHIPRVLNIYGPTECSVFMTAIEVPKVPLSSDNVNVPTSKGIAQIGWPLPDVKVMIMNEAKHVVPIGRVGELHIAGPIVSSTGYLNFTKKNKQSFFPNPSDSKEIIYATGDLMYMLPNRMLQFVGRKDGQIKLRGIGIHLQEVTDALSSHPDVQYATSLVVNPSTPSATLISLVMPKKIDKSSLLEHAKCHLPSHMVPSVIITDDELIRYKLSKDYIQSRALQAIEEVLHADQDDYSKDPVLLSIASEIAALFGKVLDIQSYPTRGDFFAFGGHSLLCFQLLKEVNQKMRVRLSLNHIMQNSTPLALASVVNELKYREDSLEPLHVSHSNLKANAPVSNSHQPFPHQKEPGSAKNQKTAQPPMLAANEFDYLEPVPNLPLSADLEVKLTQMLSKCKNLEMSSPDSEDPEFHMTLNTLAQETGFYVPSHSLVHYDSLEVLQAHLKLKTVLSFTSYPQPIAVTLQPPASRVDKPIFFIHSGVIGWSLSYAKLAKRLATYSVAIQRTPEAPVNSFEEMASFYLEYLQLIQPKGPYRLVGVCYGAYLVYELMRQLSEKGERVELAVLINNSPVNENRPVIFDEQGLPLPNKMAHPFYFYESTLKLKLGEDNKLMEEHNKAHINLKKLAADLLETYPWLPFSTSELAGAYEEFIKTLKPAWFSYIPQPIKHNNIIGKVMLIRNKEHPFFISHDFGLLELLNGSESLDIILSPRKLGLLNEEQTVQFISNKIRSANDI